MAHVPKWFGSLLVCLQIASFFTGFNVAYILLNLGAVALLFIIALPGTANDAEDSNDANPDGTVVEFVREPGGEVLHYRMASRVDYENSGFASAICCCCCNDFYYYSIFMVLTNIFSWNVTASWLRIDPVLSQTSFGTSYFGPNNLLPSIFFLSYGILVGASTISFFHRYLEYFIVQKNSRLIVSERAAPITEVGGVNLHKQDLLQPDKDTSPPSATKRILVALLVISIILSVGMLASAGIEYQNRQELLDTIEEMVPFGTSFRLFVGEAHVTGFSVEETDDWCSDVNPYRGHLDVNVSVAWGGSWACRSYENRYCEAEVSTEISCMFSDLLIEDDDATIDQVNDDKKEREFQSAEEYANFRYHAWHSDDDAYDPYAFDYDPDSAPSKKYWNYQGESIWGDCETCQAVSTVWLQRKLKEVHRHGTFSLILIGMGLSFLGWPLWVWFKREGINRGLL